ncbi:unnamed protein product [Mytilus coruscus]|uniref:Uncharacterized protein n=1 Tax=Mytilus coruscus TaxID=42192 RepID=A0A6J8B929_MYTCO|nr:unnamed protein product [Mytilus coruscus]
MEWNQDSAINKLLNILNDEDDISSDEDDISSDEDSITSDKDDIRKSKKEDQHTQTWNKIIENLENGWGWFDIEDVFCVSLKQGNDIIVDKPAIGEDNSLDNILLDYLPHAVSFVFVVNTRDTGGIHENKLLKFLKTIMDNREKMPCFDPREVMFLTNWWDLIENDDSSSDEDDDDICKIDVQHTMTWKLIQRKF